MVHDHGRAHLHSLHPRPGRGKDATQQRCDVLVSGARSVQRWLRFLPAAPVRMSRRRQTAVCGAVPVECGCAVEFVRQGHGRYSGSNVHVVSALHGADPIDVRTQAVILRHEGSKPVDGWLGSASAPPIR